MHTNPLLEDKCDHSPLIGQVAYIKIKLVKKKIEFHWFPHGTACTISHKLLFYNFYVYYWTCTRACAITQVIALYTLLIYKHTYKCVLYKNTRPAQ